MIVEKDIARLSVGTYVVDIVKQSGDQIIKTKGWVRDLQTIEGLIEMGVERVLIDTSKKLPDESEKLEKRIEAPTNQAENKPTTPITIPTPPKVKLEFAESIRQAKAIFDESKNVQGKFLMISSTEKTSN